MWGVTNKCFFAGPCLTCLICIVYFGRRWCIGVWNVNEGIVEEQARVLRHLYHRRRMWTSFHLVTNDFDSFHLDAIFCLYYENLHKGWTGFCPHNKARVLHQLLAVHVLEIEAIWEDDEIHCLKRCLFIAWGILRLFCSLPSLFTIWFSQVR